MHSKKQKQVKRKNIKKNKCECQSAFNPKNIMSDLSIGKAIQD